MSTKQVFILDENVYIQSHTGKDIHDNTKDNFDSLHLIIWMLQICHKIGINNELLERYNKKSKIFKDLIINPIVPNIWSNFLTRSDKQRFNSNNIKDLPEHFEDDRHVIELAIFLKAPLVTADERLKKELPEWLKHRGLELTIKTPSEILADEGLIPK